MKNIPGKRRNYISIVTENESDHKSGCDSKNNLCLSLWVWVCVCLFLCVCLSIGHIYIYNQINKSVQYCQYLFQKIIQKNNTKKESIYCMKIDYAKLFFVSVDKKYSIIIINYNCT